MIDRLLKSIAVFLLALLMFMPSQSAFSDDQEELKDIISVGDGYYTCSYDGVRHAFIVDLAEKAAGSPLVLMLHGYGGTGESFRAETAFEKDANPLGYTVVYVTGAPNPYDKTSSNSWNSGIGNSPNQDTGFLIALANYLQQEYCLDRQHTVVVGYSNGAFMAHRLALEASDTFFAAVSVGGTVPADIWNERNDQISIGLLQITGEKDDVIPKHSDGSARYAKEPAIEDVIEYYVTANGIEMQEVLAAGKKSTLTKYGSPVSDRQVWHLFVKDGRHSWSGERITGISTNRLILDYLETQIK